MAIDDLTFTVGGSAVFDPQLVGAVATTVTLTNNGSDTMTNLGIYLKVATWDGGADAPAYEPPETDYQDILTWGSNSDAGLAPAGGITVSVTQNGPTAWIGYITRAQGADLSTKIRIEDLAPGASTNIDVILETPPSVTGRNVYFDMSVG